MSVGTDHDALGRRRRRLRARRAARRARRAASRRTSRGCAACRAEVDELRVAADALPASVAAGRAAARAQGPDHGRGGARGGAAARRRAGGRPAAAARAPAPPRSRCLRRLRACGPRSPPRCARAAARRRRRPAALLGRRGGRTITRDGRRAPAPGARARRSSVDGDDARRSWPSGCRRRRRGRVYQVWLERGRRRARADRRAVHAAPRRLGRRRRAGLARRTCDAVMVTDEPAGGSPTADRRAVARSPRRRLTA